jgi:DNA-binding IscR family transcriptional regulator
VAASHQNDLAPGQRIVARRTDPALREELAILLAAHVTRDFLSGHPAPGGTELAGRLRIPRSTAAEALDALVAARLLARTAGGREPGYLPAHDPEGIRLGDLRDALRRDPRADVARAEIQARMPPRLRSALDAGEAEARHAATNSTLRELATLLPSGPPPAAAPEPAPRPPGLPAPAHR